MRTCGEGIFKNRDHKKSKQVCEGLDFIFLSVACLLLLNGKNILQNQRVIVCANDRESSTKGAAVHEFLGKGIQNNPPILKIIGVEALKGMTLAVKTLTKMPVTARHPKNEDDIDMVFGVRKVRLKM